MDVQTVVVRAEDMMSANVDDEVVILNLPKDNYIGLDAIGRRIWELLEIPFRVDDLVDQLVTEFDATKEQVTGDVMPFLEELTQEGLVRVVDEPSSG